MKPTVPMDQTPSMSLAHAKAVADRFQSLSMETAGPCIGYLFACQLCATVAFSPWLAGADQPWAPNSMANRVVPVISFAGPAEIFQPVVGRASVWEVASLHAFRAGADESLKNQAMNEWAFARRRERHSLVAIVLMWLRLETYPDRANGNAGAFAVPVANSFETTPHTPVVADEVATVSVDFLVANDCHGRIVGARSPPCNLPIQAA